jgi:hypothetical protein
MSNPKFIVANILTAFKTHTIGTKVLNADEFLGFLGKAVAEHDFNADRVPGQGFITLPEAACTSVSAGVGRRTADPADYVIGVHRGRVGAFLRREKAAKVETVASIIYTKQAYLQDPDVAKEPEEAARVGASDATHVIVAVLASAGPKPPLTATRFVHNLAGGNREAEKWTADEIRAKAKDIGAYGNEWCVVAD